MKLWNSLHFFSKGLIIAYGFMLIGFFFTHSFIVALVAGIGFSLYLIGNVVNAKRRKRESE